MSMEDIELAELRLVRDDIAYVIRNLSRAAYNRYESYEYSAGFFESLAADLISTLPTNVQEYWLGIIQRTTTDIEKEPYGNSRHPTTTRASCELQEYS